MPRPGFVVAIVIVIVMVIACGHRDEPERELAPARTGAPASTATMPNVDGAKLLDHHAGSGGISNATLCIDEADAIARLTAALAQDGWADVRTRATGDRIQIAATRSAARFSALAVEHDDRCAGTLIAATIMTLGAAEPR